MNSPHDFQRYRRKSGLFALTEENLIPVEAYFLRHRRQLFDVPGLELRHKRMVAEHCQNSLPHRASPFLRIFLSGFRGD